MLQCKDFLASDNDVGTIPDEIGSLQYVQIIDFSNNRVNNLPPTFGQLKISLYLQVLHFGVCLIIVQTLRELYLANNKLFYTPITPAIGQLKALVRLDLSGNQLEEIPPELANCSSLEFLDLRYAKLYFLYFFPLFR